MATVITLGETVLDIIFNNNEPVKASPGGSALNTAVSLARSGINSSFTGVAGKDPAGILIQEFLSSNNINIANFSLVENSQTAISLAFLNYNADAEYQFYRQNMPGIEYFQFPKSTSEDLILISSYFAVDPKNHETLLPYLQSAKKNSSLIVYDLNFRKNHMHDLNFCRANILSNISLADIIKASEEDLLNVFGKTDLNVLYQELSPENNKIIIKTAGKKPVQFKSNIISFELSIPEITPISTIGAGDSFNAGIIYGLMQACSNSQEFSLKSEDEWKRILDIGIEFSKATCLSLENYVPTGFIL